jgi:hypothetical protein
MNEPTPTHVINETGDRLVVVREVSLERNVINERISMASWPADVCSQRMWALSALAQGGLWRNDDVDAMFVEGQKIIDWITQT